jgi:hypothetical protein
MRDAGFGHEAEVGACSDGCGAAAHAVLEAAHVRRGYRCHAGVGLVVFGLADGCPFFGFGRAVDDEFGEAVCGRQFSLVWLC